MLRILVACTAIAATPSLANSAVMSGDGFHTLCTLSRDTAIAYLTGYIERREVDLFLMQDNVAGHTKVLNNICLSGNFVMADVVDKVCQQLRTYPNFRARPVAQIIDFTLAQLAPCQKK